MFTESEIRPEEIFNEFLRLAEIDANNFFKQSNEYSRILCPACELTGSLAFIKSGFSYELCDSCLTLYVSPRPHLESFEKYYKEGSSVNYWSKTFYPLTAESRREKIWKPKAKMVLEVVKKKLIDEYTIFDIGGGYGIFAEEYSKLTKNLVYVIEPNAVLAQICRDKKLLVIEKFLEKVNLNEIFGDRKIFTSFELFEHLTDPKIFLQHLRHLMKKRDLFIFTTLSGMGLDIQILWKNHKSVNPPHHLNFFNPESVKLLLEKNGFGLIDVSTPGKIDLDILKKNINLVEDRFWSNFIKRSNSKSLSNFQEFISKENLSSHMMVTCEAV